MRQIQRAIYAVQPNEIVTIRVEAIKVGLFVFFAFNGKAIDPATNDPLTFTVKTQAPSGGTDFGMISCHFPSTAPDDATYQLFLAGSGGGGEFTGPDIEASDDVWDRALTFECF